MSHQAEGGAKREAEAGRKERCVESRVVEWLSGGRGARPFEWSLGRKTGAKWKRGKRGAERRREGEGKHSREEERSDGARNYG